MAPACDIFAYIMASGRRDGAGWGRLGLVVTVTVIGSRPTVTPIIIMAAVVQKPWCYTSARALTNP